MWCVYPCVYTAIVVKKTKLKEWKDGKESLIGSGSTKKEMRGGPEIRVFGESMVSDQRV